MAAASSALAQQTEPIRIEYRVQSGLACPSATEFEAQVFSRTASARAANDGEQAREFVVELRATAGRVTGSLVIQETDGATMARRVRGSACRDVATVLALATALAIDPRAELAPDQTLEDPPEVESDAKPEQPPSGLPEDVPTPAPGVWRPRWALGATAAFGVAPEPAFGASLMFAAHRRGAGAVGELAIELAYRQSGASVVKDAEAVFHFYTVRPILCFSGIELGDSFYVAPCAVFEAGGVTGVGSRIPNSSQKTRFWATGELLLRLELALGGASFLMLEGGVASPLTRYRFLFENPNTSIHEVPAVTATTALRIGTNF